MDVPARTYLYQLCADTECRLEDQTGAMDYRDGWRESESGKSGLSAQLDDDDDDDDDDDEEEEEEGGLYYFMY